MVSQLLTLMDGIKGRGQATALSVIGCDLKFEDFMKLGIGGYWREDT